MSTAHAETSPTDPELIAIIQSRDNSSDAESQAAAFEELHQRYARLILSFLHARTKSVSKASDLAQDVWVRVWQRLPDQFDGKNFRAWLFRIARNLLIDDYRKKKPEALGDADSFVEMRQLESDILNEQITQLRDCVSKLDEGRQQIVRCRLAGESHEAISKLLGIPSNTIQSRFHRAKQQLAECVQRSISS